MSPSDEVTLREFMELKFQSLEKKVDSLEERFEALENYISNDIKHVIKVWKYISGLFISAIFLLTVAWLKQRLGI